MSSTKGKYYTVPIAGLHCRRVGVQSSHSLHQYFEWSHMQLATLFTEPKAKEHLVKYNK